MTTTLYANGIEIKVLNNSFGSSSSKGGKKSFIACQKLFCFDSVVSVNLFHMIMMNNVENEKTKTKKKNFFFTILWNPREFDKKKIFFSPFYSLNHQGTFIIVPGYNNNNVAQSNDDDWPEQYLVVIINEPI